MSQIKTVILGILLCFLAVPPLLPAHFHAFRVATGPGHVVVDPDAMRYVACDVDINFRGDQFVLGHEVYTIYRRERPEDSMFVFFSYRALGHDSIFTSETVLPTNGICKWRVLVAWPDSTKAFEAQAIK